VVLVGRDAYTAAQWAALRGLVLDVRQRYGEEIKLVGHRDVNGGRTCPGFDVAAWEAGDMQPLAGHLIV
jgi:N-acetyl-anhydromuramyl-L-alanine amidase AmpD